ncbi:hypothetical protein QJS10_CPB11g02211 [Acorus calamus]|uniref:Uncharacterized protein n=1 Tax=Acorus calamus TaxID=4465 RepID=A0AAV9DWK4_ACOCL|nr:hypothetical protein QJS10_CPB11g02211 [Acorus calamus]
MGKLNYQPNMTHFGHPHPLELSNLQHQSSSTLLSPQSCSCCKVRISGWAYQCAACKCLS